MWIEKRPLVNDTVKVYAAEWTGLPIYIGICIRHHDNRVIIDIGNRLLYWSSGATFYVFVK